MVSKENRLLIERLPVLCLLAVWMPQYIYRLFYDARLFFEFDSGIYILMTCAITAYIAGSFVIRRALILFRNGVYSAKFKLKSPISDHRYNIVIILLLALSSLFIYFNLISIYLSGQSLNDARNLSLEDWSSGGFLIKANAVIINLVLSMMIAAVAAGYQKNRKIPWVSLTAFILLTVAAYSRTHLLIGLTVIALAVIKDHPKPFRIIATVFSSFLILFMLLSIVTKDNSSSTLGSLEIAIIQLEVYFFGGVAGLDFYNALNFPSYNTLLTIPKILHTILPLSMDLPPSYYDFVDTTPPINVFSAIYPPFHDFGIMGIFIFFFIYGLVATFACHRYVRTNSLVWLIVASFFVYCTLMSVFDDQFIRGLPVFIMFVSGSFLFERMTTSRNYKGLHAAA